MALSRVRSGMPKGSETCIRWGGIIEIDVLLDIMVLPLFNHGKWWIIKLDNYHILFDIDVFFLGNLSTENLGKSMDTWPSIGYIGDILIYSHNEYPLAFHRRVTTVIPCDYQSWWGKYMENSTGNSLRRSTFPHVFFVYVCCFRAVSFFIGPIIWWNYILYITYNNMIYWQKNILYYTQIQKKQI